MQTTKNTILITGGGAGIGFAIAETFIKAGNEVLICGRRESKLLEANGRPALTPVRLHKKKYCK